MAEPKVEGEIADPDTEFETYIQRRTGESRRAHRTRVDRAMQRAMRTGGRTAPIANRRARTLRRRMQRQG